MSKSIRSQLTPEEIHDRREQRVAEAVAHKLLGTSPPKRPPLPIKINSAIIAEYRISEVEDPTDLGYPWSKGPWYLNHHMRDAIRNLSVFLSNWEFNVSVPPVNHAFALPAKLIRSLRERVDPALHIAHAELDEGPRFSATYKAIESEALGQVLETCAAYKQALPGKAKRIAKQQTADQLTDIVRNFHDQLVSLQSEIADALSKLPPQEVLIQQFVSVINHEI